MKRALIEILWVCVAAGALGCYPGLKPAVRSAVSAETRGDLEAALRYYETACEKRYQHNFLAPPVDQRAHYSCKKIEELRTEIRDVRLHAARKPCSAGDVEACRAAVDRALAMKATSKQVEPLLDEAGALHAQRCATESVDPQPLIQRVRCLERFEREIGTQRYRKQLREARKRAASRLVELADEPSMQDALGARAQLLAVAAHYDTRLEPLRREAWKSFQAQRHATVALELDTPYAELTEEGLCGQLRRTIGDAIECASRGAIAVHVVLDVEPAEYSRTVLQRSKKYQSGTHRIANPALPGAQQQVLHAQRALERIEGSLAVAKADCEGAKSAYWESIGEEDNGELKAEQDAACAHYESVEEIYNRRYNELQRAKQDLYDTPELLSEPVYSSYEWAETHHLWTHAYRFEINGRKYSGVASYESMERPGFAPAGIEAHAVREPSAAHFAGIIRKRVAADVGAHVNAVLSRQAEARRASCKQATPQWNAEWLECRAETSLWEEGRIDVGRFLSGVPDV